MLQYALDDIMVLGDAASYHPADTDFSCSISLPELNSYIVSWKYDSQANPMGRLIEALVYYYSGNAC